jgi:hypothetical protein
VSNTPPGGGGSTSTTVYGVTLSFTVAGDVADWTEARGSAVTLALTMAVTAGRTVSATDFSAFMGNQRPTVKGGSVKVTSQLLFNTEQAASAAKDQLDLVVSSTSSLQAALNSAGSAHTFSVESINGAPSSATFKCDAASDVCTKQAASSLAWIIWLLLGIIFLSQTFLFICLRLDCLRRRSKRSEVTLKAVQLGAGTEQTEDT